MTNQRETTVAWDRETGRPLANAIVWSDSRTFGICEHVLKENGGNKDVFRKVTGLPVSTYFSAYKLKWLLRHVPAVAEAAEAGRLSFGTVDSWVIYNLTGGASGGGVHVTDVTNASRTSLMNVRTLEWDPETIRAFGVDKVHLPKIVSSAERYGDIVDAAELGLVDDGASGKAEVPICGCVGDQQAAVLGQRTRVNEAKCTYGTGCFILLNTGERVISSRAGLLTTVAFKLGADAPAHYALEGAIAVAGQGVSWLRDSLGIISSAREVEELAGTVADAGGVAFVPAFGGLLAPWWRSDARGALLGITQYTTKAHVARAMLDAIAFQAADVVSAMLEDAGLAALEAIRADGGAAANALLLQTQADLLQTDVVRPVDLETTSAGAALAAGIASGFWTVEEAFDLSKRDLGAVLVKPKQTEAIAAKRHAAWKRAVEHSFGLADELSGIGGEDNEDEDK